jgi:hypothetical protein
MHLAQELTSGIDDFVENWRPAVPCYLNPIFCLIKDELENQ